MKMILKNGLVYQNHSFLPLDILTDGGVIKKIGTDLQDEDARVMDLAGKKLCRDSLISTRMEPWG